MVKHFEHTVEKERERKKKVSNVIYAARGLSTKTITKEGVSTWESFSSPPLTVKV